MGQRNGSSRLNTTAANSGAVGTSLHWFEQTASDFLVGTFEDNISKMDSLDGTWDDITGALTLTTGQDVHWTWKTFNTKAYGTNNVDLPALWDGVAASAIAWPTSFTAPATTSIIKAKWAEDFENYFFLANVEIDVGVGRKVTRLYWSTIDDAETWDAADFVEIGLEDGQEISGLKKLGDRLVIYKERSIYIGIFTGDADIPFVFKKTPSTVGAISGYSIQEVKNGHIFLAEDGIYFFDGFQSRKLSDRINKTIDGLQKSRFEFATSVYQKSFNRYWLMFTSSGGSTHDTVIVYDDINDAFSIFKGLPANAMTIVNTSGEERIYFSNYAGFTKRADDPDEVDDESDAGVDTAVETFYKTKWFNFQDIYLQKGVLHTVTYYDYSDSTLVFKYSYDLESGAQYSKSIDISAEGSLWDTALWDVDKWGSEGGSFFRCDHAGRGRLMRLVYENLTVGERFDVNAIGFFVHAETHV